MPIVLRQYYCSFEIKLDNYKSLVLYWYAGFFLFRNRARLWYKEYLLKGWKEYKFLKLLGFIYRKYDEGEKDEKNIWNFYHCTHFNRNSWFFTRNYFNINVYTKFIHNRLSVNGNHYPIRYFSYNSNLNPLECPQGKEFIKRL